MKSINTLFLNLVQRIKNALESAKDYSDANLQTGLTYRRLDWANIIKPISTSQQSTWTYTAPKDGQLLLSFFSGHRTYIGISINDIRVFDFAINQGSLTSAIPVTLILSRGDVVRVPDLNSNTWLGINTAFVPFVGGVIVKLFSLLSRKAVTA